MVEKVLVRRAHIRLIRSEFSVFGQELEWGGGLKQRDNREEEMEEITRIAAQPFARPSQQHRRSPLGQRILGSRQCLASCDAFLRPPEPRGGGHEIGTVHIGHERRLQLYVSTFSSV